MLNKLMSQNALIDVNLLILWGATFKKYQKNEIIFFEGEMPEFYFQIESGCIRMFNDAQNGKEFTQGLFSSGQSFGEPALLLNKKYPANSEAIKDSVIIKLSKVRFNEMLEDQVELRKKLLTLMCERVYQKSTNSKSLALDGAEERILRFFTNFKEDVNNKIVIPFTRQEIANFLGLRIETVIRAISKLKNEGRIEIVKNKILV